MQTDARRKINTIAELVPLQCLLFCNFNEVRYSKLALPCKLYKVVVFSKPRPEIASISGKSQFIGPKILGVIVTKRIASPDFISRKKALLLQFCTFREFRAPLNSDSLPQKKPSYVKYYTLRKRARPAKTLSPFSESN